MRFKSFLEEANITQKDIDFVNKVWDFIDSKPFFNPEYSPKFVDANTIYNRDIKGDKAMEKKFKSFKGKKRKNGEVHRKELQNSNRRAEYERLNESNAEHIEEAARKKVTSVYDITPKAIKAREVWPFSNSKVNKFYIGNQQFKWIQIKDRVLIAAWLTNDATSKANLSKGKARKEDSIWQTIYDYLGHEYVENEKTITTLIKKMLKNPNISSHSMGVRGAKKRLEANMKQAKKNYDSPADFSWPPMQGGKPMTGHALEQYKKRRGLDDNGNPIKPKKTIKFRRS